MVRFKNRYVCFEVELSSKDPAAKKAAGSVTPRAVNSIIRESVKLNFGDLGAGLLLSGLQVKYFSSHTWLGIVKVPRDHCKMLLTALTQVNRISKQPCSVRVRHVSGTIKKCQRAAIRVDRELIISWHQSSQDGSLNQILKDSESQISALEI